MAKDNWDKWEIVGKVAGAVLIPSVIAIGGLYFNAQENLRAREATEAASKRAATAQMMQIAVGVLTSEPTEETKALRKWASEVLRKPGEVIAMNDEATVQLLATPLAKSWGDGLMVYAMPYVPKNLKRDLEGVQEPPGAEFKRPLFIWPAPEFEFQGGPAGE